MPCNPNPKHHSHTIGKETLKNRGDGNAEHFKTFRVYWQVKQGKPEFLKFPGKSASVTTGNGMLIKLPINVPKYLL